MHHKLVCWLALVAVHGAVMAEPEEEISSDRPDFVDSAAVVGKGVFQVEAGLAQDRNRDAGRKERSSSTPFLLRIGVADTLELRLESDGRLRYRADDIGNAGGAGGGPVRERGYGDAAIGLKWHVRDGEEGRPAIGIIGQVDLDTGSRAFRGEGARPSLRITGEWDLAPGWSLGVMPGIAAERDERGRRFASAMLGASLGKDWSERVSTFFEFAAQRIARSRHGGSTASVDIGASYLLTRNLKLDAAVSRGLNRRTPDYSFTFGLAARL